MSNNQHQKRNESEMRLRKERKILMEEVKCNEKCEAMQMEEFKIKYAMTVKMEMGE